MCGIAGIFAHDPRATIATAELTAMAAVLGHRGPDGSGVQVGPGYGLSHRRLSVVDLGGGQQPMGADGLWVTYNGEVYNHVELRAELEAAGCRFTTACDTEVLLHGYRAWGSELPQRLVGMFAFAIVDTRAHRLFLARDRLGKKPLYLWRQDGRLAFASEPKALLGLPGRPRDLDPAAVAQLLALRYVPDPRTVFAHLERLPPATAATLDAGGAWRSWCYWQPDFSNPSRARPAELEEQFLELFDEAVRCRLMGDVPLGAFLSGGIDSQAVVEAMARVGGGRVVACTMGFDDPRFDERPAARAAARACGAVLHEGVVSPAEMLEQDWYATAFDEPFADASAVPTFHVSRLARRHVTVALTGDGGDESFAGYRRYAFDVLEHRWRRRLPTALWRVLGGIYPKADFLPRVLRFKRTLQALGMAADEAYARSVSATRPEEVGAVLRAEHRAAADACLDPVRAAYRAAAAPGPLSRAIATDLATYLPGDILVKVDRASMAVSLEARAPLLDHRIVEFAARLPDDVKLAAGRTKAFLRSCFAGRLDAATLARRKRGFSVPLRRWMGGRLGDELGGTLDGGPLAEWVDVGAVRARLRRHRAGSHDDGELLWALLVLDRFLRRWG